ncbi:MAG: glutamate-5-semialdehyde dehydrogenase, partial [Candidatus Brocadia sp.]
CIQLVEVTDREAIDYLLIADQYIDVVIPRGGEALIRTVVEKSTIPVIKHYKGVCHTYVDEFANLAMAGEICYNAKVQRPATCNAMETLLVHEKVAPTFLPNVAKKLSDSGVEIRGCDKTGKILDNIKHAADNDYYNEYLDLILNVKVVKTLNDAINHISTYGSHHSDAIVTDNINSAMKFTQEVDSAAVYINASTRFTDGYEFGMGAEIGISTDKLHARGPMGIEELTTYKFVVFGNGQLRK